MSDKIVIKVQYADFYSKLYRKCIEEILLEQYEIEYSDEPDFLFYSVYGTGRDHYKYKDCVKIFYSVEGVIPDFNECDYAVGSYPMTVGDRYLEIPYFVPEKELQDREKFRAVNPDERKFCNFIYSNATIGKGAAIRQDFCKLLMEYRHVDCPGNVLNNMKDAIEPRNGNWNSGKLDFIKDYKFTIAFENVALAGMTTEKLVHPLSVGSIPIYWGDPLVAERFNPKAFINCNDYSSFDQVIDKIKELDQDNEKYMEMVLQPSMREDYNFEWREAYAEFLYGIIEKGNTPFEKDPIQWDAGSLAAKSIIQMEKSIPYKLYCFKNKWKKKMERRVAMKNRA